MNEQRPAGEKLERLLDRTLRELPLRQAPRSLEARVLDAIESRASRPWWRLSFGHWPDFARSVFVVACAGLVWISAIEGIWALGVLDSPHGPLAVSLSWAREATAFAGALSEILAAFGRVVPSAWLSNGLALSAGLYAVLFGLGIAGYRLLHLDSRTLGNIES
ncbi:MAG: hypothetical protein ABSF94_09060 [Steroidobacteraceae bacterium]|jgi:hypothetical protein